MSSLEDGLLGIDKSMKRVWEQERGEKKIWIKNQHHDSGGPANEDSPIAERAGDNRSSESSIWILQGPRSSEEIIGMVGRKEESHRSVLSRESYQRERQRKRESERLQVAEQGVVMKAIEIPVSTWSAKIGYDRRVNEFQSMENLRWQRTSSRTEMTPPPLVVWKDSEKARQSWAGDGNYGYGITNHVGDF